MISLKCFGTSIAQVLASFFYFRKDVDLFLRTLVFRLFQTVQLISMVREATAFLLWVFAFDLFVLHEFYIHLKYWTCICQNIYYSLVGLMPIFDMPIVGKSKKLASNWFLPISKKLQTLATFGFTKCCLTKHWHQTNYLLSFFYAWIFFS